MASVQADKVASLSTKAPTFIKTPKQDSSGASSLPQPEQTKNTAEQLNNPISSLPVASPAPVPPPGNHFEQPATPAVSAPPLSSLGNQHVRFETPPTGYSYSNTHAQTHTTSDPSHQASDPLPPIPNYPELFNFGYGPPNLPPISSFRQPGPYGYYQYSDEWQGGAVPSVIPGGRLAQNYKPYYYGPVGPTQPIYAPNFSPSSVIGGSYNPHEDGPFIAQDAPGPVDLSNQFRRNTFSGPSGGLSTRFGRDSDSDSNSSSVSQDATKDNSPPYVLKLNKAAAYRRRVERRHENPFAPLQAVRPPSTFSSASAQTTDTFGSTATSSSKASKSSKSSAASKVPSAISSNTSVDSEDEKDNRKPNDPPVSVNDEKNDVAKSNSPKITRVVLRSGSGKVKVKFAGSEADLGGGAECSYTTVENATNFEGSVLDDDSEDPLISLEHPVGTAKEPSLIDATDPFVYLLPRGEDDESEGESTDSEEDSENEEERREMIRRGKQAERFSIEDIITQEDSSDSQQQTPATLLYSFDASTQSSTQTPGPSEWTRDSLDEVEAREDTDKGYFQRKTVTFDPYSSEDLDIFNDCIEEGPGNFNKSLQLLSSITSPEGNYVNLPARFHQRRFCDDRLSSSTSSRPQSSQVFGFLDPR
jgi:hypothetical protein